MIRPVFNKKFKLGEGLFWDTSKDLLFGVDIDSSLIWYCQSLGEVDIFIGPKKVSWIIKISSSEMYLVGFKEGISMSNFSDSRNNSSRLTFKNLIGEDMRLNDAKADPQGNVWGGVMSELAPELRQGYLYKIEPNGSMVIVDDCYGIPNGPAFSPDSSYMLHTDSWLRTIYIYDFDSKLGLIKNKRIWKNFPIEEGFPDGMCFDSQGCIWIAHWGCGKVCRYDVDGALMATYHFPASHVSNVCFGGGDLSRLFVTSATAGLDSNQVAQQELAGSLFEISNVGVLGLPPFLAGASFVNLFNEN